jgi:hypothetical protein
MREMAGRRLEHDMGGRREFDVDWYPPAIRLRASRIDAQLVQPSNVGSVVDHTNSEPHGRTNA